MNVNKEEDWLFEIKVFSYQSYIDRAIKNKTRFKTETGFYDRCNKNLHVLLDLLYEITFWLCAY
jgi:hypothetical protein